MALKPRRIFNRGSFRKWTLNVKCTLLTQFCMFALHLKEKCTFKKNHHLFKPQAVFSPASPMSPIPDLLLKADFSPTSKISMFKTCSILTGGKKRPPWTESLLSLLLLLKPLYFLIPALTILSPFPLLPFSGNFLLFTSLALCRKLISPRIQPSYCSMHGH